MGVHRIQLTPWDIAKYVVHSMGTLSLHALDLSGRREGGKQGHIAVTCEALEGRHT